jgi:hypothetical protein
MEPEIKKIIKIIHKLVKIIKKEFIDDDKEKKDVHIHVDS